MKKLLISLIVLVLIGASLFLLSLTIKGGMADTAEKFFTLAKAKNFDEAYSLLSEDFRASTSKKDFIDFLMKSALIEFKEASWSNRSISGNRGELEGSVVTESGGTVPLKLVLIRENKSWKIYSLSKPKAGIVSSDVDAKLPDKQEQIALVKDAIMEFALAVNAKDFSQFHNYISGYWQKQITVEELNEAFKSVIDSEIDLTPLEPINPIIDEPTAVSEKGVLAIKGHYPTVPLRVIFDLDYIYEGFGWKMIGIHIQVKPVE